MTALTKYADSDNTKDPGSDEEKSNQGKKNNQGKSFGNNGNQSRQKNAGGRSELVATANTGPNVPKGNGRYKPYLRGNRPPLNLEATRRKPCPEHSTPDKPSMHAWGDCFIIQSFSDSSVN